VNKYEVVVRGQKNAEKVSAKKKLAKILGD
jgi:hypothetical protein